MKRGSFSLLKYLFGFSFAFLAVSNCFNVLSNSSSFTALPGYGGSLIEAPKANQHPSGLALLAGANGGRNQLESNLDVALISRAAFATGAPALSPGAPVITATKSHTPSGSANPGDTLTYTVVISNSGTGDATGVNFSDTIDPNTTLVAGSLIASPIAVDDSYHTIGNVNISVPVGQGVIANDTNPNGTGTLTVTQVNSTPVPGGGSAAASTANGSVTMNSDGSFSYNPNVAFRGPSDSFTYTLGNGTGKTDTATVTISVNGLIWFVNSAAASGGDGRLGTPFNCLVGPGCFDPAAADIANDNIFVYSGSYTGGLTLLSGQKLIGQGAGDTLLSITGLTSPSGTNLLPSTGGANPTISAAGADLTLATGNTIRGVTLNGTTAAAVDLTGSAFGTVSIAETVLGGTGQALNLNNGTLSGPVSSTAAFTSISSSNSSSTGVSLTTVSGNMSSGSTTITNPTGIGISVNTSSAALNFGSTTSTLSGGTGVSLTTNTGTITFGSLDISPDANQRGLLATNNTTTITATGGAITTTGSPASSAQPAVEITRSSSTTPLVMSLTSVSTPGGPHGIVLTNTSGSFAVMGDGSNTNNSSGGTIQSTTGNAVSLSNVTNVSLASMNIHNSAHDGINGTSVNGFSITACSVLNNGSAGTDSGIHLTDLSGTATLNNDTVTGSNGSNVVIDATASSTTVLSTLTVTNGSYSSSVGGTGFLVQLRHSAAINTGSLTGVTFSGNAAFGLDVVANDDSTIGNGVGAPASGTMTISGCAFTNTGGVGVSFASGGGSGACIMYARFVSNTLTGTNSHAINVVSGATSTGGTQRVLIDNNQIGTSGVPNSGSAIGEGIVVTQQGKTVQTVTITNNIIRALDNDVSGFDARGIDIQALGPVATGQPATTCNYTIVGNDVDQEFTGDPFSILYAIYVAADDQGSPTTVNAAIHGNTVPTTNPCDTQCGAPQGMIEFEQVTPPSTGTLFNFSGSGSDVSSEIANTNTGTAGQTCSTNTGLTLTGSAPPTVLRAHPIFAAQSAGPKSGSIPADDASTDSASQSDILHAARGEAPQDDSVQKLSQRELNWMVQAAIERWRQAAISSDDLTRLQAATFELTDLPSGQIASAASSHIKIDETAAGYGWFYDQTPDEDSEFDVPVPNIERQTTDLSVAHGRMDLLTVVMRELGTVYMQGKNRVPKSLRPLMESTLSPAVRRMPVFNVPDRSTSSIRSGAGQSLNARALVTAPSPSRSAVVLPTPAVFNPSADLMPGSYGQNAKRMSYAASARRVVSLSPFSGETVTLNIGTIPAGESVTIMFQVTINTPLPNGVCSVTNQGHVTGSNFSPVDTNSDVTPINKAVTIGACPANITTHTDAGVCTAVVTFTTPTGDGCPTPTATCSPASGTAFAKGVTTVTCTATNGNPPDATCSFTVTVNDTQAPTITCPGNVTQGTDAGVCTAVVTYANATATDNCPGVGTPVCTPASGSTFNKGTTTVTCTVSDASSNSANCSFTVTINDTTPPTITCPANVTKSTDPNQCQAVVTYSNATASDNCPGVGSPVCTPSSGSTFLKGVTTVTCTVSDSSSNSANCSFTVTVKDTQAPNLGPCPSNISVTSSGGCQVVNYTPPTATDNCGSATVVCSPGSGTCFPAGTTTVTCTASDTSPDSPDSSCSFTVTVVPCAITCPSNISVGNDPGQCGAAVTYSPNSNGGCGTIVCSPSSGSFFPVGTTTVMCTTTAGPGCSFTVTVNDTEGPVITVTTQPIELWPPNHHYHTITMGDLVVSATDNCSGNLINNVVIASVSSDEPENGGGDGNTFNDIVIAPDCKSVDLRAERQGGGNGRVYTIVLRVTDAAGNVGTASRTVTVPLSQGSGPAILGPGPGYTVTGTCP